MSSPTSQLTSTIVRAGAGAGKTTELTTRVLRFALNFHKEKGKWPRLVVCTFTRKATQELRERLIREACKMENWELLRYTSSPSQLHISTIHGVLSVFLRRYGRLEGLDPGFKIISDRQATLGLRKILRKRIFQKPEYSDLLEEFRVAELLKILSQHYPAWILSGKTMYGLSSEEGRAVLEQRLREVVGDLEALEALLNRYSPLPEDYISFLGALQKLIRKIAEAELSLKVLDELSENWPKRPDGRKKANKFLQADHAELIKMSLDKGKAVLESAQSELRIWPMLEKLQSTYFQLAEEIFTEWRSEKIRQGQLQMEDLELLPYEWIESRPELAQLFSQDWDYWLVDEYQDTSPLQDQLIEKLKGEAPVFFVGDPQQSIYLFRGARFENFEEKMRMFQLQSQEVSFKTHHYRSRGELLEFFNDFFTQVDTRFLAMTPHREVREPQKVVAEFYEFKKDLAKADRELQEQQIAVKVKALLQAGVRPKEIAVLARKGRQLKKIAEFLKRNQFPIQLQSSGVFGARREVQDLGFFLRFLLNPHDNVNLVGLLRSPWMRISDREIMRAAELKADSLWQKLHQLTELETDENFSLLKRCRERLRSEAASDVIETWIGDSGFADWSRKIDPSGRREANIWKWLHGLRKAERQAGFNYLAWLKDFQTEVNLEDDNQEGDALSSLEPDRIQLMTIHAAKGLEFEHVIIPFCEGGRFPQDRSLWYGDPEAKRFCLKIKSGDEQKRTSTAWAEELSLRQRERELDESLRVLYVGMTRAKESVSLIWCEPVEAHSWAKIFQGWLSRKTEFPNYRIQWEQPDVPDDFFWQATGLEGAQPRSLYRIEDPQAPVARKLSVSQLLPQPETPKVSAKTTWAFQKWGRAAEGALIHKVFESLQYRDEWDLPTLLKKYFSEDLERVQQAFEWALKLTSPPLADLIRNGQVEWGFQYKTPVGLMEGQVDLWGEDSQGRIWIVDYKTGKSAYEEKAFQQLWLYSLALRKLKPKSEIHLAVIYPFEQKVSRVPAPTAEPIWGPQGEIQNWPSPMTMSESL